LGAWELGSLGAWELGSLGAWELGGAWRLEGLLVLGELRVLVGRQTTEGQKH